MNARVIPLPLSISNAYLLLGDRPVLVDAGAPGDGKRLAALLRERVLARQPATVLVGHGGPLAEADVRRRLDAIASQSPTTTGISPPCI